MSIKKKIAGCLACILLLNPLTTLGNVQDKLPPDGIDYVQVSHDVTNDGGISPKATVTFKTAPNSTTTNDPQQDMAEAEYYRVSLTDSLGNTLEGAPVRPTTNEMAAGVLTRDVHSVLVDSSGFSNGRLYKLNIIPGHTHYDDQGNLIEAPISSIGEHPSRYFVTDFNTIAREVEDDIEILWEYIPGATYTLKYIDKDVDTKDAVDSGGVGSVEVTLTEDDVDIVTENGIKKVKYVLEGTIPGQKYSAYVIVKNISDAFLKDKFANVGINTTTPKVASVSRSVSLDITNISNKRIQLKWQLGSWADGKLVTTKIWRKTEGETSYTQIGTINNTNLNPQDPGKFEHDEPSKKSYYYIEFVLTDGTIYTKEEPYTPYELREQPLKPQVPSPFYLALREEENFNKKDYLVKNDDIAAEKMLPNTFHVESIDPLEIQLVWDAPKTKDDKGNEIVEHSMAYDIWVTDQYDTLLDASINPVVEDLVISSSEENNLIKMQDGLTVVGYKNLLTEYTLADGSVKNLATNRTYYIKIVAKRDYNGIYTKSSPTIVAITVDKNGDIFTPPILAKPPLRIQENGITKDSVTIEWLEKWYEIKAKDPSIYTDPEETFFAPLWNSAVYTGGTPAIKFKGNETLRKHILRSKIDLDVVKKAVGEAAYKQSYEDREVTLGSDVKYEVKAVLYDEVLEQIKSENANLTTTTALTIEKWVMQKEHDTTEGWNTISPGEVDYADGLQWKDYTVGDLKENTRYIIMIRAYRELDTGEKLQQTYPSYVIATTNSEYESPEADPVVPNLNPYGVTDSSVSVWWVYNSDFEYEIVYSRVDDPEKAETWEFEISDEEGTEYYVENGGKAIVHITGLLPETTYNVWIRAKQKEGDKISEWSNPVVQKTDSIERPDPPRGLGPAAYSSLLEIGQDFASIGSDWITVEWMRDVEDVDSEGEEGLKGQKVYSYYLEFADNPELTDAIALTIGGESEEESEGYEILAKNIVKFTGLAANRPYYVRAKTILTFTDEETGKVIQKESDFTVTVRILTGHTEDEYDGGGNDHIIIYDEPVEEDFEDGIWTWEIVDTAKVISDIIASKEYYYTITLDKYKNKYDASMRRIKMPKDILDTLINQKMAIRIVTQVGAYDIPANTLKYYSKTYSARDTVQFDLTEVGYTDIYSYARSYPEELVDGERLEISFRSDVIRTVVNKLDGYMRVKLRLSGYGAYQYRDFVTYTYKYELASWSKEVYTPENLPVEQITYLTYQTATPGLFALYEKPISSTNNMNYNMNKLSNKYNITGLGSIYFNKDYVNRNQYIKLILGVAEKRSSIDLTTAITYDEVAKARNLGIYIGSNSGAITEEQAIAGIVKLYELTNGYQVKPSSRNFSGVSSNYKTAVQKAYAVGLIEEINPQHMVTYSQLVQWILQVTE